MANKAATFVGIALFVPTIVAAAIPSSGQYVDPFRPGVGFGVEVQGDHAGIVIYVYDDEGRPEFYVAGGRFTRVDSGVPSVSTHVMDADLYRPAGGFQLLDRSILDDLAPPPDFTQDVVGRVRLSFTNRAFGQLSMNLAVPDSSGRTAISRPVQRIAFGVPTLGEGTGPFANACWPDMRGEWVFVDTARPADPSIRANLSTIEIVRPLSCITGTGEVVYRDLARGLSLVCRGGNDEASIRDGARLPEGCELQEGSNETPTLSFLLSEYGVERIDAL